MKLGFLSVIKAYVPHVTHGGCQVRQAAIRGLQAMGADLHVLSPVESRAGSDSWLLSRGVKLGGDISQMDGLIVESFTNNFFYKEQLKVIYDTIGKFRGHVVYYMHDVEYPIELNPPKFVDTNRGALRADKRYTVVVGAKDTQAFYRWAGASFRAQFGLAPMSLRHVKLGDVMPVLNLKPMTNTSFRLTYLGYERGADRRRRVALYYQGVKGASIFGTWKTPIPDTTLYPRVGESICAQILNASFASVYTSDDSYRLFRFIPKRFYEMVESRTLVFLEQDAPPLDDFPGFAPWVVRDAAEVEARLVEYERDPEARLMAIESQYAMISPRDPDAFGKRLYEMVVS